MKLKFFNNLLTSFAGLDIYDLSHQTRIEQFVPKLILHIVFEYFANKIDDESKMKYFKTHWKIGLA